MTFELTPWNSGYCNNRDQLHVTKLDEFSAWAAEQGWQRLDTKGDYEVLRLHHRGTGGEDMKPAPTGSPDAVRCSGCGALYFPALVGGHSLGAWDWIENAWWHGCDLPGAQLRLCEPINEGPIGFTCDMVIAILEGRKLETRRLPGKRDIYAKLKPGDILYGREAWQLIAPVHGPLFEALGRVHRDAVQWDLCGGQDAKIGTDAVELTGSIPKARPEYRHRIVYKATHMNGFKFRPGMHMPKWMSRLRLEMTGPTRKEPVNIIDDAGALREGVVKETAGDWAPGEPVMAFEGLWDSIHPGEGMRFGDGPDVRVIPFRRVWP